jgi:dienelactone hydrolase
VERPHWLDRAFGVVLTRAALFRDGWGDPEVLERLSRPEPTEINDPPLHITWGPASFSRGMYRRRGFFESPARDILRHDETQLARIEVLLPASSAASFGAYDDLPALDVPVCLHLASSGEENFLRRRRFARPLVARGIGAVILENPYYGSRRPKGQRAYLLRCVTDQLAMNRATVREAKALLSFFHGRGHRRIAVSGYSMGGFTAALTSTRCAFPVAVVPCAAGLSPATVFTEGVLSGSVRWSSLGGDGRQRLREILDAVASYLESAKKPTSAIIVAARSDGFVPAAEVEALHRAWPEAELRWVEGGHVSAYVRHQTAMRQAIIDAMDRLG